MRSREPDPHFRPHFRPDGSGLCQCGCDDCTLRLLGACICPECACEEDTDHRQGVPDPEPADREPRSIAPDAWTRTAVYLGEQRDV